MKNKKGFTLIELLIVVAIIGLLATLAIISLTSAQSKARDTKRIADLNSLQSAVEMYYNDYNSYPVPTDSAWNSGGNDLATALDDYLSALPATPGTGIDGGDYYTYGTDATGSFYCLATVLENENNQALDQDIDVDDCGGTTTIQARSDNSAVGALSCAGSTEMCLGS